MPTAGGPDRTGKDRSIASSVRHRNGEFRPPTRARPEHRSLRLNDRPLCLGVKAESESWMIAAFQLRVDSVNPDDDETIPFDRDARGVDRELPNVPRVDLDLVAIAVKLAGRAARQRTIFVLFHEKPTRRIVCWRNNVDRRSRLRRLYDLDRLRTSIAGARGFPPTRFHAGRPSAAPCPGARANKQYAAASKQRPVAEHGQASSPDFARVLVEPSLVTCGACGF